MIPRTVLLVLVLPAVLLLQQHPLASVESSSSSERPSLLQKWSVARLPKGTFKASRHLILSQEGIIIDDDDESGSSSSIELAPDQALVRVEAFSIDAFLRTLLEEEGSFHYSLKVGDPMRATGYGTVIRVGSRKKDNYQVGQLVVGILPVANLAVVQKSPFLVPVSRYSRSSNRKGLLQLLLGATTWWWNVDPSLYLGLLGTSGLSAYVGLFCATPRPPRKGDTVVISAAAGGVGTCAAQMAQQLTGARRVVGIAGGPEKKEFLLTELGLDAAIDYKDPTQSIEDQLAAACPDGIDFFFDNVGGPILDAVLERINPGARIVICGAVSQYDTGTLYSNPQGPQNYLKLAERSATMSGFVLGQRLCLNYSRTSLWWATIWILWHYRRGNLKSYVQIEKGIESFGPALEKLLNGKNTGRLIVDVTGNL